MSISNIHETAKWFLTYNRFYTLDSGGELLTCQKLQCLLYYAQGYCMAIKNKLLFESPIIKDIKGPKIPVIEERYAKNGAMGIQFDEDFDMMAFPKDVTEILACVYEQCAQFSTAKLLQLTKQSVPFAETKMLNVIEPEKMRKIM